MRTLFMTGIGTDVGKTVVSAIVTEALSGFYWKPVQAGFDQGTDRGWVGSMLSAGDRTLPEAYKLVMPASPHIAARAEGITIDLEQIAARHRQLQEELSATGNKDAFLVVEGAGGLMVPLNEKEFIRDLALRLQAPVILVSRNYLGSINHSLLTAESCKAHGLRVAGWIFNDHYGDYESEIAEWSGIPSLGSIPFRERPDAGFIREQAAKIREGLLARMNGLF